MRDVRAEKRTTATDTVVKLFGNVSPKRMTSMGMTRESPPVMATMKRATLSTKGEMSLGALPFRNPTNRDDRVPLGSR